MLFFITLLHWQLKQYICRRCRLHRQLLNFIRLLISKVQCTEDPRDNDSVCYQRFCCKIEFSVMKKLDKTHLKHQ